MGASAEPDDAGATTRFERFLLSIMGPAQIGEDKPPDGYLPDPTAELCPKCSLPWAGHTRRHKGNVSYLLCSDAAAGNESDRGRG